MNLTRPLLCLIIATLPVGHLPLFAQTVSLTRSVSANASPPPVTFPSTGQGSGSGAGSTTTSGSVIPSFLSSAEAAFQPQGGTSNSGAFTYSLPLDLPPGTNGMAPSLSIQYNSSAPNDLLGVGFSLSGFSRIERDPMFPLNFDASDHYTLDGEKLVYSSADKQFHPQRENFDRLKAYESVTGLTATRNPNRVDSWWEIKKKDGTVLTFGDTPNSRIDAVGKSGLPRVWALSKVADLNGNYYTIAYNEDLQTGAYAPAKIVYTQNDNSPLAAYKAVLFTYENRPDHEPVYRPTKIDQGKRLQWITVMVGTSVAGTGGTLLRKYRLNYETSPTSGRSRLTTVQEYGSDGISTLPPTKFAWPQTNFDVASVEAIRDNSTDLAANARMITGDFDGDGMTDVLRQEQGINAENDDSTLQVRLASGGGFTTIGAEGYFRVERSTIVPGDYNGDGMTDFIRQEQGQGSGDNIRTLEVFLATGGGHFAGPVPIQNNNEYRAELNKLIPGDFNGDGMTDFLRQEQGSIADDASWTLSVSLATGDGHFAEKLIDHGLGHRVERANLVPGDYNGDGMTDFIRQEKGDDSGDNVRTLEVFLATGAGNFSGPIAIDHNSTNRGELVTIIPGDFNGDGIADFLKQAKGTNYTPPGVIA